MFLKAETTAIAAAFKKQNKIDLAIQDEENAIKFAPTYAHAYLILGNIYLKQNNRAKAADLYKKGLAQKPEGQIKTLLESQLLKAK